MTCYNHEEFVAGALDSLEPQFNAGIEVVLIDDASRDASVEVAKEWIARHPNAPVSLVAHRSNKGFVPSLNEGLRIAAGKYICMFSADDLMHSNRLGSQAAFLESMLPNVGAVYSEMKLINRHGIVVGDWGWGLPVRIDSRYHEVTLELIRYNPFPVPAAMFRREVFELLDFLDESLDYEDYDLWLRMSDLFSIRYLPGIASYYRVLPESMSRSETYAEKLLSSQVKLLMKRADHSPRAKRLIRNRLLGISVESSARNFGGTAEMAAQAAETLRVDLLSSLVRFCVRNCEGSFFLKAFWTSWSKVMKFLNLIRLLGRHTILK